MSYNDYRGGEQMSEARREGGEVVEPKCSGCGKQLLCYLTEEVADGLRYLRCNAVNETKETIMKAKREARAQHITLEST
jgi:hypothetical protein